MKSNRGSGIASCARLAFALAASAATLAHAEWSSNPAANLVVADDAGGSTQPHIVAAPDGGFYVSWNSASSGYDIRLQRLDADGNELWPHGGILVADRSYSFTYDYGIAVDASGNAYVAYNCCVNLTTTEHISVNKVSPDGTLQWGTDGVTLQTGATEHVYAAYVTVAGDGKAVVAWSADGGIHAQKLDAGGAIQWAPDGVVLTQPSGTKLLADIRPSTGGDVIVSWSNQSGSARILRAQRLASANGAQVWSAPVQVFDQGNLQSGYFPKFIADGSGGGVFYDYDIIGTTFYVRVQHLDAAGNKLLDPNGVLATTDTTIQHGAPAAAFDAASGSTYIVWRDYQNSGGSDFDGVSAQRIDAAGNRMWGDTGQVLVPLTNSTSSANTISQLTAIPVAGDAIFTWTTGSYPTPNESITATRLGPAGAAVWTTPAVVLRSTGITSRTSVATGADGFAAYVFEDGDESAGTPRIMAQNLDFDGHLGPVAHAPGNDAWTARTVIPTVTPGSPFSTTEDNPALATTDASDPVSPCIGGATSGVGGSGFNTLWYSYTTGNQPEYVNLDTQGTYYYYNYNVNTGLLTYAFAPISVYTGEPGSFRLVAGGCNATRAGYAGSSLLAGLRLEPNTTYSIEVASTNALWTADPPATASSAPKLQFSMSVAPVYTVDRLDDPLPAASTCDPGNCSIRAAINASNATPGTIMIPAGTYAMTATSTNDDANANGDFDVATSTSIYGAGMGQTIIQAPDNDRVFDFIAAATGTSGNGQTNRLQGVTLRGPGDPANGGTGSFTYGGGLLRSRSTSYINFTSLVQVELANGYSTTMSEVALFRAGGGAMLVAHGQIIDSDIHDNVSAVNGGGLGLISLAAPFEIRGTTIRNNVANNTAVSTGGAANGGGGVFMSTAATIVDSTITGNRSKGDGGGLSIGVQGATTQAKPQIRSSTIAGNVADSDGDGSGAGGGVQIARTSGVDFHNDIAWGNSTGVAATADDCSGSGTPAASSPTVTAYNIAGAFSGAACGFSAAGTDLIGVDPLLGTLAANGGPTLTMALGAGSPAIDAGNPAGCADASGLPLLTDQRGMARIAGARCDIGAYELASTLATPGVPVLDAASDSGSSNSDDLTNVVQPTVEGTCDGGLLHVLVDGTEGATAACSGSTWQATVGPLADGVHAITVYAVDGGGAPTGLSPALAITIDTQTSVTITSGPSDPSASADATFVIDTEAGDTLSCALDAAAPAPCSSPVTYTGLGGGAHTLVVTAIDAAGNQASDNRSWTIIGPAAPGAPMLDAASDSGASNTDGITNAASLLFHGSCEQDGDQIRLFDAGNAVGNAVTCAAGAYAATLDALAEGAHAISATTTRGGLGSAQSAAATVTIDRTAPAAPLVTSPTPPVTAPFTLAGSAEALATVAVTQGASTVCTTMVDAGGQWSCAIVTGGSDAFGITATDVAGNTGPSTSWSPGVDVIFADGFDG